MAKSTDAAGRRHVLVVDDNVVLAQTFAEVLQMHDYHVTLSHDGTRALECLRDAAVDAIVCDLIMPQQRGDEFYHAARSVRPELAGRFIFITGHAGNPQYEPFLKMTNAIVLYKPILMDSLLTALEELFARPA